MLEVRLQNGPVTLIDECDEERVRAGRWYSVVRCGRLYVAGRVGDRRAPGEGRAPMILMHRYLLNAPRDVDVKHLDNDGLNNTRENLAQLLPAEAVWLAERSRGSARSRFQGVSWSTHRRCWRVTIGHHGERMNAGFFDDEETAARAFDAVCLRLRGGLAKLNFTASEADAFPLLLPWKMRQRLLRLT